MTTTKVLPADIESSLQKIIQHQMPLPHQLTNKCCQWYEQASPESRKSFFLLLSQRFGTDFKLPTTYNH